MNKERYNSKREFDFESICFQSLLDNNLTKLPLLDEKKTRFIQLQCELYNTQ